MRQSGLHLRPLVDMKVSQALHYAEQVYRANLLASQPAIAYLMARGVGVRVARAFGIGYAGESFKALSSALNATTGGGSWLTQRQGRYRPAKIGRA